MTRRPHWAGELLVVGCLLFVYDFVAGLVRLRSDAAEAHGRDLLALSPWGLEKAGDAWLAGVAWLHDPAAYYYDLAHVDVTVAVLVACYVWRAEVYRRARNALVAVNVVCLAVFLVYPVAPPRLLPGGGFADVVADSGTWGAWKGGVAEHANEFASMPSVHLAWAVWVALTVASMTTRRWVRAAAWVHVVLTSVVVVITGNHYVLDLVAGAAVAAAAWVLAPRVLPLRGRAVAPALAD